MTAGESTNFWQLSYDELDEIKIGNPKKPGMWLRLVESHGSKKRYIQLWSTLSKQWRTMYSYNVMENWSAWKRIYASIHLEKHKDGRNLGSSVQLDGTAKSTKRTTRRKASSQTTKDSKQSDGKPRSKSTRRVQGSAKK